MKWSKRVRVLGSGWHMLAAPLQAAEEASLGLLLRWQLPIAPVDDGPEDASWGTRCRCPKGIW